MNPAKILQSSQLPTLPTVAVRLLEAARNPETSICEIVELVQSDPAIAAKILKSVNSSFFGMRSEIRSIERAVPILGTGAITTLALSFSLSPDAVSGEALAPYYKAYWLESLIQAAASDCLARRFYPGAESEFFLAALLADLGRLAMLKTIGEEYRVVLDQSRSEGIPLFEAEKAAFGFDHSDISMQLLAAWKMSEAICLAVSGHHLATPPSEASELDESVASLNNAVRLSAVVAEYYCSDRKAESLEQLRRLATAHYALDESGVQELLHQIDERINDTGHFMSVDTTDLPSPADLLAEANEQLVNFAMRAQVEVSHATIRQQEMQQQRQELESRNIELQQQAMHDPLTGLYNRKYFDDTIARELSRCSRQGETIGAMFADIDNFKSVNDTYGHAFGDEILRVVGRTLCASVRESDVVARYGGEEFVVLACQPTEKGLARVAERIRANVEQLEFSFEGQAVRVTISLGTAFTLPRRKADALDTRLIEEADQAMYDSKRDGRNRVTSRNLVDDDTALLLASVAQRRFSRWLVAEEVIDVQTATKILSELEPSRSLVGELACRMSLMSLSQVEEVLAEQRACQERFGEIALRRGMLTRSQLIFLLAVQREEPKSFAAALIRKGGISPETAVASLECYLKQVKAELATAT